jgi:hypothetical protein
MEIYEVELCQHGRWEQQHARFVAARDADEAAYKVTGEHLRSEGERRKLRLRVKRLGNGSPPPKLFTPLDPQYWLPITVVARIERGPHPGHGCGAWYCGSGRCHHSASMNDWLPDDAPGALSMRPHSLHAVRPCQRRRSADWSPTMNRRQV